jgi:hypothetical protein
MQYSLVWWRSPDSRVVTALEGCPNLNYQAGILHPMCSYFLCGKLSILMHACRGLQYEFSVSLRNINSNLICILYSDVLWKQFLYFWSTVYCLYNVIDPSSLHSITGIIFSPSHKTLSYSSWEELHAEFSSENLKGRDFNCRGGRWY